MRFVLPSFFAGQVVIWSGSVAGIPSGWALCDGTQGTPDLRDKFTIAAGNSYPVDSLGGTILHPHDFTTTGHQHSIPAGFNIAGGAAGVVPSTTFEIDAGTTDNGNVLPPYYSLAYVMKL